MKDELEYDPKFYDEIAAIMAKYNLGNKRFQIVNEGQGKLLTTEPVLRYNEPYELQTNPILNYDDLVQLQSQPNDLDLNLNWVVSFWLMPDHTKLSTGRLHKSMWYAHQFDSSLLKSRLWDDAILVSVVNSATGDKDLYINGRYVTHISLIDETSLTSCSMLELLKGMIGFVQNYTLIDYAVSMYSITMLDSELDPDLLMGKYKAELDLLINKVTISGV